jgi:hypothetical protein
MLVARNASEEHAAVFDRETPVHASVGVIGGLVGVSLTAAVLTSIGVEFVCLAAKDGVRHAAFGKTVPASSLANHAADLLATVGGFYLGRWLIQRSRPA